MPVLVKLHCFVLLFCFNDRIVQRASAQIPLLNELSQPLETFKVSHSTDDGTHENFNWTDSLLLNGGSQISSLSGGLSESQMVAKFFFTDGVG